MYIHVTRKTGLVTNIKTADGQTDTDKQHEFEEPSLSRILKNATLFRLAYIHLLLTAAKQNDVF